MSGKALRFMNKLYIIAYGCEPGQGSEAEVGWQSALEIRRQGFDITVITRTANAKRIIDTPEFDTSGIKFVFLENRFGLFFKHHGSFSYLYYFLWQFSVFRYLHKKVESSDIVHVLTFGNIQLPTFVQWLKGHLVLGPMGGGALINPDLMTAPSLKRRLECWLYRGAQGCFRFMPTKRALVRKADVILLRTEETRRLLPAFALAKSVVMLETGILPIDVPSALPRGKLHRIITVSRMIDSKNIDQLVAVYNILRKQCPDVSELIIVGDGPLLPRLKRQFAAVPGINFPGKIPHEQIGDLLKSADLFLFTSIKEGGSHALFEAALYRLPIACYKVSGMTVFPPDGGAIKITPVPKKTSQNVERLAAEIVRRFRDPEEIQQLTERAYAEIERQYYWDMKCRKYGEIYNQLGVFAE